MVNSGQSVLTCFLRKLRICEGSWIVESPHTNSGTVPAGQKEMATSFQDEEEWTKTFRSGMKGVLNRSQNNYCVKINLLNTSNKYISLCNVPRLCLHIKQSNEGSRPKCKEVSSEKAAAHLLRFSTSSLLEKLWPLPQRTWRMPGRNSTVGSGKIGKKEITASTASIYR